MDDTTPKPPTSMGIATQLGDIMRPTPRYETDPVLLNRWIAEHRTRISCEEMRLRLAGVNPMEVVADYADEVLGRNTKAVENKAEKGRMLDS